MLFGRVFFSASFLIAISFASAYWFHVRIRSNDAAKYRKLIQESAEFRSRRALERHPAHQMREGVQKDIWAVDGTQRLHFKLNSGYSELTIRQKRDKFEAIEELQQIHSIIQEEIDPATQIQQVRTLSASEGTYYYPSHRFLAHAVHLGFYRLPGVTLPASISEKPFLTGVARQAEFAAAAGKAPVFTAYGIAAQVDPEKCTPLFPPKNEAP